MWFRRKLTKEQEILIDIFEKLISNAKLSEIIMDYYGSSGIRTHQNNKNIEIYIKLKFSYNLFLSYNYIEINKYTVKIPCRIYKKLYNELNNRRKNILKKNAYKDIDIKLPETSVKKIKEKSTDINIEDLLKNIEEFRNINEIHRLTV